MILPAFALATLAQLQLPRPGQAPPYVKPVNDTSEKYFTWIEQNTQVVYPALAAGVLLVLVIGVLLAWKSQEVDGAAKAALKRDIVHELRKQLGGVSAEDLAKALKLETFALLKLLEEMQREGLVTSHMSTQRMMLWNIKGIGPSRY